METCKGCEISILEGETFFCPDCEKGPYCSECDADHRYDCAYSGDEYENYYDDYYDDDDDDDGEDVDDDD